MNISRMGFLRGCLASALALVLAACGGGGDDGGGGVVPPSAPVVTAPAKVTAGGTGYVASVAAQAGLSYAWTINGGTITSGGQGASATFTAGSSGVVGFSVVATDASGHASVPGVAQSTIYAAPVIGGFAADTTEITSGQSAVLSWTTTGATTITIDHGVGDVSQSTSTTVSPTASTQYTLSATNPAGTTVTATAAVAVDAVPVISSFTATPATITGGGSATLAATFAGGTGRINPGNLAIVSGGSVNVSPTADQTYTLTVTNAAGGTTTATASVALGSGYFTVGAAMVHPRSGHTATLLQNGKVLIVGGSAVQGGSTVDVLEAELYDPATGSFQATGALLHARSRHSATLLADGRVLIAGGGTTTAELYDPVTGLFTATGTMTATRNGHAAARLGDGKVLILGGIDAVADASGATELYDPSTGLFTASTALLGGGYGVTALVLADGRVLVPGGSDMGDLGNYVQTPSETFDSTGGTVTVTGALPANVGFRGYLATVLSDGRVLVAGGYIGDLPQKPAAIFDPTANTYAATGSTAASRYEGNDGIVTLANGKALVLGKTDELFDPATGTFSATGGLAVVGNQFTATLLSDGTVLVVGGYSNSAGTITTAQIYH